VYISASAITIGLAYAGLRYYALAIQAILTAFFTFLWNMLLTKPKFRVRFRMESIRKVLNYSGFQFAFNIVNYFSRNLDNLLTGKFFGDDQLGYYNKAYTLMLYPVNNLTGVVSPVLHPILSDYQAEKNTIYTKYMKIVRLLALLGLFIAPVCFLASDEIIQILYGPNWVQTIACFRLLALAIIPQMINSSAGAIFQTTNNTKLLFFNSCINTAITVGAILTGIFAGGNIVVLSACVAVSYNIHFLTAFYMLIKLAFGFSLKTFVKDLIPEGMILLIMVVGVVLYPFHVEQIVLSAMIKGIWLLLFYCAGLVASKEYKLLLQLIRK
jgi:PST family polysaccharide transporter